MAATDIYLQGSGIKKTRLRLRFRLRKRILFLNLNLILNLYLKMLYFPKEIYNQIITHAKEAYPNEGCGALIGEEHSEFRGDKEPEIAKNVLMVFRMKNINKDRAKDRYEIDPKELLRVEKEAFANGLQVIGFYHSHPDHPDMPSAFDRERAWPFYSYVIISVKRRKEISVKSWIFEDEKEPFKEEEVKIVN